jgi:CMP/dCMP kinase
MATSIPVIAIDGPSGSGKGTISQLLAQKLGWHFLDSGALYRVLALAVQQQTISIDNPEIIELLALQLDVKFEPQHIGMMPRVILEGDDVTDDIRSEICGNLASKIAVFPAVRKALLERQRAFRMLPGLVADGRDMGTVVFKDAALKIFLQATDEERAKRRYRQLQENGINVSLEDVLAELKDRDDRDKTRSASPLVPAEDAIIIDTTGLSIEQVIAKILAIASDYMVCAL